MKARRYTEEQIIVLKEADADAGTGVADLCRKYGMRDATYYNWKVMHAGFTVIEIKRPPPFIRPEWGLEGLLFLKNC